MAAPSSLELEETVLDGQASLSKSGFTLSLPTVHWSLQGRRHDSCYYCSVTKLCTTLWDPIDCSMPGFPVPHHLPVFAQVHVL